MIYLATFFLFLPHHGCLAASGYYGELSIQSEAALKADGLLEADAKALASDMYIYAATWRLWLDCSRAGNPVNGWSNAKRKEYVGFAIKQLVEVEERFPRR